MTPFSEHSEERRMGDIAEMILEGILCEFCGVYLGEGQGFPDNCKACEGEII